MANPKTWKFVRYKPEQFDDPLHPGSGMHLDEVLLINLEMLERRIGCPLVFHSSVGGCVDVNGDHGHAGNSYHLLKNGASAVDFHFDTTNLRTRLGPREQRFYVYNSGFGAVGCYSWWHWGGKKIDIGFHVDMRPITRFISWESPNKGKLIYGWS